MDLTGFGFMLVFVCLLDFVKKSSAATCSYINTVGERRYTFCLQKCCDDNKTSFSNVCCPYDTNKEVYMGAGMATLIVLSIFAVCFTYICCKHRIRRQYQGRPVFGRQSTRDRDRDNNIPTVSLNVEPIQPPAYDSLPPPYYTQEPGTSDKKEEFPPFDVGPPPAYSP